VTPENRFAAGQKRRGASNGTVAHATPVGAIASRFGVVISEKVAAKVLNGECFFCLFLIYPLRQLEKACRRNGVFTP